MSQLELEKAKYLFEHKCIYKECWHRRKIGYTYCICCLYGICSCFTGEEQEIYKQYAKEHSVRHVEQS